MKTTTWERIKKYTELQGTSGQEHEIRKAFRAELTPLVDEVAQEGLGAYTVLKMVMVHGLCLQLI